MTKQPDFAPGTLGEFLERGQSGWPQAYTAHLDGAAIRVVKSTLHTESQRCTCTRADAADATPSDAAAPAEICYLRVCLDLNIALHEGGEHTLHVEELFPWHIIDLLNAPLDEHAAARARRAISDAVLALDPHEPVARLLSCPIAPMRLYEPLLNALVQPVRDDSLAAWIGGHLTDVICNNSDTLAQVTVGDCSVRVTAREVAIQSSLRARGEVKLMGEIELNCAQTGARQGSWKSRAVLMPPAPRLGAMPAPNPNDEQRIRQLASTWRARLEANLASRLADGPRRFTLAEVLPELALIAPGLHAAEAEEATHQSAATTPGAAAAS